MLDAGLLLVCIMPGQRFAFVYSCRRRVRVDKNGAFLSTFHIAWCVIACSPCLV